MQSLYAMSNFELKFLQKKKKKDGGQTSQPNTTDYTDPCVTQMDQKPVSTDPSQLEWIFFKLNRTSVNYCTRLSGLEKAVQLMKLTGGLVSLFFPPCMFVTVSALLYIIMF